jgi:hypothetical protein
MAWTFSGLKNLDAVESYKSELAARLASAEDEDAAQKLINEDVAWQDFNEAVDALERETSDPRDLDFLDVYRKGRKRYYNCYVFKHGPFTVAYFRDPVARIAIPFVFFHHRDRAKRLRELADLLRKYRE